PARNNPIVDEPGVAVNSLSIRYVEMIDELKLASPFWYNRARCQRSPLPYAPIFSPTLLRHDRRSTKLVAPSLFVHVNMPVPLFECASLCTIRSGANPGCDRMRSAMWNPESSQPIAHEPDATFP